MKRYFSKTKLIIGGLLVVALSFVSSPTFADTIGKMTDSISSVGRDQVVDGTALLSGATVNIDGTVKGDVFCAGQNVVVSGVVEGDVFCTGQRISITGTVSGDVRALGASVAIDGKINGSMTVMAYNTSTGKNAKIGRDVVLAGQSIRVDGSIGRDAALAGAEAVIDGNVGRDIKGEFESLAVADKAKVGGKLTYYSDKQIDIKQGVVAGGISYNQRSHRQAPINPAIVIFVKVMSMVLVAAMLGALLPEYTKRIGSAPKNAADYAKAFLVGLVAIVVTPFITLMLAITVIGLPVALAIILALILALILAMPLAAYRLGQFLLPKQSHPWLVAAMGALACCVIGIIPIVGPVFILVVLMIGFGMILLGMQKKAQPVEQPVKVTKTKKK